ncbi:MAG: LacI family DNA-binding transcriptional regulator [Chloroflexi bacterium]|nr:LacI family DNA-binding transcriptional regulator [Chloroflexota bacterium]
MSNRLTIIEIAKHSGVSRSTVSRVINDDPNVNTETRERVRAVMQKLNFHPNVAARGLAAGKTRILGLVIPMGVSALFSDPYFPQLIQGISAACNQHNYSTMLWLADPEYERRMIQQIVSSGLIEGVIVASALNDDPVVEALMQRQIPFVLVGRHPTHTNLAYVDVDNRVSARDAVLYLMRLGYQRVATIAGPHNMIAGVDRLNGYKDALKTRGIAPDPNLIAEGDFSEGGGYQEMQRLLRHAPDAVFVASDAMALGAMRALREAGKRVPDDIALVGFDDMPFAAHTEPPLTTVRQPIHRAGFVATETLLALIAEGANAPRRVILPTELVIRETCGAHRASAKPTV